MFEINSRYFEANLADGAPVGGGNTPAAPAPPSPDSSALGNLAAPNTPAANSLDWVQAKYLVKDAAGKVDEAASIRKQAEAYNPLVARMGSDELRPEKATDYKLAAPEGADAALFNEYVKDPDTQKFIEAAHAKGFNNSQVQFALEAAMAMVPELEQAATADRDAATTSYVKEKMWKNDAAMKAGFSTVLNAVDTLAAKTGISREAFTSPLTVGGMTLPPLINDPRALALLSAIAPELKTGNQPANSTIPPTDLESLMKNPAYLNANHADHAAVKAKVKAHFDSLPNASGKPSGPMIISSAR